MSKINCYANSKHFCQVPKSTQYYVLAQIPLYATYYLSDFVE